MGGKGGEEWLSCIENGWSGDEWGGGGRRRLRRGARGGGVGGEPAVAGIEEDSACFGGSSEAREC